MRARPVESAKPAAEFLVSDRHFLKFLPAAAVNEDAVAQVQPERGGAQEEILPDHESEAEDEKRLAAVFGEECAQPGSSRFISSSSA